MKKEKTWLHKTVAGLLLLYLLLPILVTLVYSIADEWYKTVLPPSYTLQWYKELFSDMRFWYAAGRSVFVSAVPIVISLFAILSALYAVCIFLPEFDRLLQGIVLLPYVIPGVVLAISLIRVYATTLGGTVWLLIAAYSVLILPYMYQGIRNSLRAINVKQLVEACELLGATKNQAFFRVIVPNILPGIKISILLSFSILFGEFALVNLLIGGSFETIQMMLFQLLKSSGHLSSALVVTYFIIVLIVSYIAIKLSKSAEAGRTQG